MTADGTPDTISFALHEMLYVVADLEAAIEVSCSGICI